MRQMLVAGLMGNSRCESVWSFHLLILKPGVNRPICLCAFHITFSSINKCWISAIAGNSSMSMSLYVGTYTFVSKHVCKISFMDISLLPLSFPYWSHMRIHLIICSRRCCSEWNDHKQTVPWCSISFLSLTFNDMLA